MNTDTEIFVDFTETIAHKLFDGHFPAKASPELIACAILEACPLICGADVEVRKYFLLRITPLIYFRKMMEREADDTDSSAKWLA